MEWIYLDGSKMRNKEELHDYLKARFKLPNYYGRNLDGLWDLLMEISRETIVVLYNEDTLIENLDKYAYSLIELLEDAADENEYIKFGILA